MSKEDVGVGEGDDGDEWVALGKQLRELNPEKHTEVLAGLRDLVEAQRIIARFDWQLMFRGRPKKRYHA